MTAALAVIGAVSAMAQQAVPPGTPMHAPEHQHLDARFAHNHYYYDRGYAVHTPPDGGLSNLHAPNGERYYFHEGNWYHWQGGWDQSWHWQRWWHGGWVISAPPNGVFLPLLPPHYTTIWWGGTTYYYANDGYYIWDTGRNQYQVVAPPAGLESAGTTPAPVVAAASDQLFASPTSPKSAEQQSQDRYECHQWALAESGYDPTAGDAAAQPREKRTAYFRSQSACLQARGYTVR